MSWYSCICRYCKVHAGFWTGYDAALVHPVFLLVLCPDCSFVHSHIPFPEGRFFSTALAQQAALCPATPHSLHLSGDRNCCIFFLCSAPVKVYYPTMHRACWYWRLHEDEAQQNLWELPGAELIFTSVLLTELCAITVILICYFKANCSIVGRSQRFSFLIPACQHKGIWPISD